MKPERFSRLRAGTSMIRKSGNRFYGKIMRQQNRMIRKSGRRFCGKSVRQQILRAAKAPPGPAPRPNFVRCVLRPEPCANAFGRSRVWG